MRKFLIKVVVFSMLLFCLMWILDVVITHGLNKTQDYRFKSWYEIKNGNAQSDVLVNGNSRALSHFVPVILDSCLNKKVYNIGFGGHPFNAQYMKYKYYLSHNKKPQILIQNVDFATLADVFIIGHEREQVFTVMTSDLYLKKTLPNFGYEKYDLYLPMIRYYGYQPVIKQGVYGLFDLKSGMYQTSHRGYKPEIGEWNPTELNKLKSIHFQEDSFTVALFDKYLRECRENGIQVFLVNSPVYYKATEKLSQKEKMRDFYKTAAQKYGYTYLDYTDDSICYDSTKFVVAVHLNKSGAEIFSRKLGNDLKKLIKNK